MPFQVVFLQGSGSYQERLTVSEFGSYTEMRARQPTLVLTENLPLRVVFSCEDPLARMYMDGLESVSEEHLEEDSTGRPYLKPGALSLFSFGNYQWIPGLYWIEVRCGQRSHFASIQVQPKEMTLAEWSAMKNELEQELQGLAMDLARHQLGFCHSLADRLAPALLRRFLVVRHLFPQVMAALADLQTRVNHRVQKVPSCGAVAARQRPGAARMYCLPNPTTVDFDLPENRWVKHIVGAVNVHLRDFLAAVCSFELVLQAELTEQEQHLWQRNTRWLRQERERLHQTLLAYQQTAAKMLRGLAMIRRADWYQGIKANTWGRLPQALQTDGRYHALYQLHRRLEQTDWQPTIDQTYHYQWKRTDRLYEIWCVIQVCRALTANDLMPVSGWLYDQDLLQAQFLVPDLLPGTCLLFQRDGLEVRVSYDQEIPRRSADTQLPEQPVYTQDVHNRPDLRLDIFQDNVYLGSLVLDCKYRPLRGFWKEETLASGYDRPKAMGQLISYGMAIHSPYLRGQAADLCRSPAVQEVWALHPGSSGQSEEIAVSDYGLRFLCLRPGVGFRMLTERLSEIISRTLRSAGDKQQAAKK
jgi:hypothetical protein